MGSSRQRAVALAMWVGVLTIAACGTPIVGNLDGGQDAGPSVLECSAGCLVSGVCFPEGVPNPGNPCEVCAPGLSGTAFSPNDGVRCDDGMFCTESDLCSAGVCAGRVRDCDDGLACNGAEACNNGAGACEPGTPTCGPREVCDALSGACAGGCAGCVIDGMCFGDGQINPSNPCQVCRASASAWSANDGATCDDGLYCTMGDACAAGACVGGAARDCDDGVACDGVEACDEDANACAPGTTACAADEVCDVRSDRCALLCTGCIVGGVCFGAGQRNPGNPCETCAPDVSRAAFSPAEGASCDDGAFCTRGDVCAGGVCAGSPVPSFCDDGVACNGVETCSEASDRCVPGTSTCAADQLCNPATNLCVATCTGCNIAGVCFGAGAANPMNACQICRPATSTSSWSANAGASCDDGLFCTTGELCSAAGACGGGAARACADAVSCNGVETCNEAADRCDPGATTCAAGQSCNVMTNACVCPGAATACGAACVNLATDATNCGTCGRACAGTEACVSGLCTPRTGFTGGTGTTWELIGPHPVRGFQAWVPAGSAFMYASGGDTFARFSIATRTWSTLPSSPGSLGGFAAPAFSLGDIWGVTPPNVMRYSVASGAWTLVRSDVSDSSTSAQSTVDGAGNVWSYTSADRLVRYNPTTNTLTYFPTGVSATTQTRVGYDAATNAIYFGGAFSTGLYRFDIATSTTTVESNPLPESNLSDAFCPDRSGHIYAALGCGGTSIWQYTIATRSWVRIPDFPVDHGCNATCSVHEDGWLYLGDLGGGPPTYRLRLL